ncbi:septation ring formation regulator EzrA [Pelagibacteraceae bacterium]|jgi:cell division protein FtsB|nr:septation ring formation regulator EzrA [Pelagibacteraceae bacterium]|tara:strand:+ start:7873 stop:8172 length:300 start_codon:yes stop_codon:yes gene_type:complete
MKAFEILKTKKIIFFQIFLTFYIAINLIGGDRGLASYFKKNNYEKNLFAKTLDLKKKLESVEHKNKLLSGNPDFDYLETLYRAKLKFGKKDEVLIKLKK